MAIVKSLLPGMDLTVDSRGSLSHLATQQIRFWVGVSLAGGIVANISAKAANVVAS